MKRYLEIINNPLQEKIVFDLILDQSDTVRLTRYTPISLYNPLTWFSNKQNDNDPKYLKVYDELYPHLLKKEISNAKYDDAPERSNKMFEHHYFMMNDAIKNKFNNNFFNPYFEPDWYGYEDPTFYKNGQMVATVVSHEFFVMLDLEEPEIDSLKERGIFLRMH